MRTLLAHNDLPRAALLLALVHGCSGPDRASSDTAADAAVPAALAAVPSSGLEAIRRARLIDPNAEVDLRDPPLQFRVELERNNGRVDTLEVPVSSLDDTTVAQLVNGAVQPRDVGTTNLRLQLTPSLRLRGSVVVSERLVADSVWLSRGQVRGWELRPGFYRITVDAKAPPGQPQPMELAADLLCAPDARGPRETVTCRVRQNTRLLMRHTGAGASTGPSLAVVTILRVTR